MNLRRTGSCRSERGATIPLTGMMLVVLVLSVAFAVDLGRLVSERRSMQADADVIALDLSRLADGRTEAEILTSPGYATTLARSAAANNIAVPDIEVEYGIYDEATDTFDPVGEPPNAVEVIARGEVEYRFARVIGANSGRTSRTALAAIDAIASLTLGSNTVSLSTQNSTVLDFLLGTLLEDETFDMDEQFGVDSDFGGYDGLADADVDANDLADADANAGSPDEVLASEVTAQEYGLLLADALRNDGRTVEADILEALALMADNSAMFEVGDAMGAEVGGPPAVGDADVNAFDQFVAGLQLANSINFVDTCAEGHIPPSQLAGLMATSLGVCTSVIEAPRPAIGRVGDRATTAPADGVWRTAQVRFETDSRTYLDVPLVIGRLSGELGLPVDLEVGGAEGTLRAILCDRVGGQSTTDTFVSPRPVSATIPSGRSLGTLDVKTTSLLGITTTIARVSMTTKSGVDPVGVGPSSGGHLVEDQLVGTTEAVPGSGLDVTASLGEDDIAFTVQILGLIDAGTVLNAVRPVVFSTVNAMLADLADPAVTGTLDAFGVGLSESDLRLNDVLCESPLLRG